jgi:cytochrome P450
MPSDPAFDTVAALDTALRPTGRSMTTHLNGTDPFTATRRDVRHAAYARHSATGPVSRIRMPDGSAAWLVTGYDETRQALSDPRLVKAGGPPSGAYGELLPPGYDAAKNTHLLNLDPPDHTRLRKLVAAAFTRRRVDALGPRIQALTDELLDALADAPGQVDLVECFAAPLPIAVICELLGVPADARGSFGGWTNVILRGTAGDPADVVAASVAIIDYVRTLVADKRQAPADDLLSALVSQRDGNERLSEDELTSMVFLLLIAGHETTVNLIGNGTLALLTHPEQLALLQARPELLPAAVEELLRFDGPLQVATPRRVAEPITLGGQALETDDVVIAGLLPANRAGGDDLDLVRERPHLAFGHGLHFCLGAPLARLEARTALGSLITRFPGLRLAVPAEALTWRRAVLLHGLDKLPVRLGRAVAT